MTAIVAVLIAVVKWVVKHVMWLSFQPPTDFPIDFTPQKLAVKIRNGDHMTVGHWDGHIYKDQL